MMLENHLRHVKPSEFNSSVIWAGRIGLLLLMLVAILVFVPFAAEQVQGASVGSNLTGSGQLYSTGSGYKAETQGGVTLSMHIAIANRQSSVVFAPRAIPADELGIAPLTLKESNWSQLAYRQGNE
ncbi:MAG: hypothetical protein U0175_25000 [Caldilineaceae bacterium]